MRRTALTVLVLALTFSVNLAQDEAPEVKEVDNSALLKDYLRAEGSRKAELKKKLLDLSADELSAAIEAYTFDRPEETGIREFTVNCPDGFERPYWVWTPEDYDASKRYPLLVCLHGGVSGWPLRGARGRPPAGQSSIQYWAPNLPEDHQDVLVLGCSAGVPETSETAVWWHTVGQKNVIAMIRDAKAHFNVDDDRVIVNGHSDGGSGAFGFAYRMPNTFAGYFAMNGHPLVARLDGSPVWLENLKGQNIYCFNGGKDGLYPSAQVIPIYEQANELGAEIEFTDHPELDHGVAAVLRDEVHKFMKGPIQTWKRELVEKKIDWTTVDGDRGRRSWLGIDEVIDLGKRNAAPENADIKTPGRRVRLGVQVQRDVEAPTVESVVAGSTAEKMGIEEGDVIKKLDDVEIETLQDLIDALGTMSPGDGVTIVVERDGEDKTLEGSFAEARQQEADPDAPPVARVIAELTSPGNIDLKVRNAGKVSILVAPEMLDEEGKLRVRLNPGGEGIGIALTETVKTDNEFILEQFETRRDRKLPWIGRIEINVKKLLGVEAEPAEEPKQEDEF